MSGRARGEWIARHKGMEAAERYEVQPGAFAWIVEMVEDAGGYRTEATFNGIAILPMTWGDLNAWRECVGQGVEPQVMRAMMHLSRCLASQIEASRDIGAQVPFDPAEDYS